MDHLTVIRHFLDCTRPHGHTKNISFMHERIYSSDVCIGYRLDNTTLICPTARYGAVVAKHLRVLRLAAVGFEQIDVSSIDDVPSSYLRACDTILDILQSKPFEERYWMAMVEAEKFDKYAELMRSPLRIVGATSSPLFMGHTSHRIDDLSGSRWLNLTRSK